MDIDGILTVFNQRGVRYLLIGGMNFLLRHEPVLTFDVDIWIDDTPSNRRTCELALSGLHAEWGADDADWGPVGEKPPGWLDRQSVFCLHSPAGAIDIFRTVQGLGDWADSFADSVAGSTAGGVTFRGLSDRDMLSCQLALDPSNRKNDRIRRLRAELGEPEAGDGNG